MMQDAGCRLDRFRLFGTRRRGGAENLYPATVLLLLLISPRLSMSESPAAKNNRANRLFEQGKYQEAEKAYLAAKADDPGKPEILYNLGNSLIKQNKYGDGIQTLGQSMEKGDKETKEKAWYNTGNVLFSEGRFKESADAFIRALKLNPADRDAKHNLELALLRLKQQEQQKSERSRAQQDSRDSNEDKQSGGGRAQPRGSGQETPSDGKAESRREQSSQHEGTLTREQALQLLEAVRNQELEEQRKMLERRARERSNGKDW
jgi:Ca-activated chloride channel homolog